MCYTMLICNWHSCLCEGALQLVQCVVVVVVVVCGGGGGGGSLVCDGCSVVVAGNGCVLLLDGQRLLIRLLLVWKWRPAQEERAWPKEK